MLPTDSPTPEELEVNVFGPGFGECIVMHLGNNEWVIIDSCPYWETPETRSGPVALRYLESIGVDPSTKVSAIVCSHWHDDHIWGLSQVIAACPSARFMLPAVLTNKEITQRASLAMRGAIGSGLREVGRCFAALTDRVTKTGTPGIDPRRASAGTIIYRDDPRGVLVQALSPSDSEVEGILNAVVEHISLDGPSGLDLPLPSLNASSIVVSVKFGSHYSLMGADLEVEANPRMGWTAVIDDATGPGARSGLIKIPHHGSEGAISDDFWDTLTSQEPIGLMTPFSNGTVTLPSAAGRALLKTRCGRVFMSSLQALRRLQDRNDPLFGIMSTQAEEIREERNLHGHVRARMDRNGDWAVQTFGDAREI